METNQPGTSNQDSITTRKDSKFVAQLSGWEELCQVIEQVQTITPVEDPEAERLERILELVKCYLNSNIGDIQPLETDNMEKKLHKIKKSMSAAVTKLFKYTTEAVSEPSSD